MDHTSFCPGTVGNSLRALLLLFLASAPLRAQVEISHQPQDSSVLISIDGQLFTSYLYPKMLKKPVLYPLRTPGGAVVTRGFPLTSQEGERVDHPHHVGLWLNYGNVNGLDFWNNSTAIPPEKKDKYGTIRHREVVDSESGSDQGMLKVAADWLTPDQKVLLDEVTTFYFSRKGTAYVIDRMTRLTAKDSPVSFEDNKEGMIGIRVTRALEHPADKPIVLTDDAGHARSEPVLSNEGVSGKYISSEGRVGEEVWGTRAEWVNLTGTIGQEQVSIVIMDHPENVGYPTYWHARNYGLFSANPLGQKVFSDGKESLNFSLSPQESVTFRYRIIIYGGERELDESEIRAMYTKFSEAS